MSRFELNTKPSEAYLSACQESGNVFHSPLWQNQLKIAFNTSTFYAWDPVEADGFSISVFSKGPFRIGYIGFPVGGTLRQSNLDTATILSVANLQPSSRIDLIRVPQITTPDIHPPDFPGIENRETEIPNLSDWSVQALSSSIRRNIKKAQKANVLVKTVTDPLIYTDVIYDLYNSVIVRQEGSSRYNRGYFYELIKLASQDSRIRCVVAQLDNSPIAYIVVVYSGKTAYYLHGGINMDYQEHRPNELLFSQEITKAKEQGLKNFNMLASPLDQIGLIRYKEKWGGVTHTHITYEINLNTLFSVSFKLAHSVYARLGRFRNRRTSK